MHIIIHKAWKKSKALTHPVSQRMVAQRKLGFLVNAYALMQNHKIWMKGTKLPIAAELTHCYWSVNTAGEETNTLI